MAMTREELLRQRAAESAQFKPQQRPIPGTMEREAVERATRAGQTRLDAARAASTAARPSPTLTGGVPPNAPSWTTTMGAGAGGPPPPPPGAAPPPPPAAAPPPPAAGAAPAAAASAAPAASTAARTTAARAAGRVIPAALGASRAAGVYGVPLAVGGAAGYFGAEPLLNSLTPSGPAGKDQSFVDWMGTSRVPTANTRGVMDQGTGQLIEKLRADPSLSGLDLGGAPPGSATPPAVVAPGTPAPKVAAGPGDDLPTELPPDEVVRSDRGTGKIRSTIQTASGGLGYLESDANNFASTPGTFNQLPNAAAMGGPGATFDAKTGQLTGGIEMGLSAARQAAAKRGDWQALEDAGVIQKRPRGEQVTLIRETPDVVPSWRREGADLERSPGMRGKIAAAEMRQRKEIADAELAERARGNNLAEDRFAYEKSLAGPAAALEQQKLATDLLKTRISAGKPTDLMQNFAAMQAQFPNTNPLDLAAALTGAFKRDEMGNIVNAMNPSPLLTAMPGGTPAGAPAQPVSIDPSKAAAFRQANPNTPISVINPQTGTPDSYVPAPGGPAAPAPDFAGAEADAEAARKVRLKRNEDLRKFNQT